MRAIFKYFKMRTVQRYKSQVCKFQVIDSPQDMIPLNESMQRFMIDEAK